MSIFEGVRDVITEKLGVRDAEVVPEANLVEDLGADSLLVTELVMELEDRFEIQIPDDDAEKIRTVQGIIDYIEAKKQ